MVFEDHSFTFTTSFFHGQVVVTQNHVLRWSNNMKQQAFAGQVSERVGEIFARS
ncbi:hypothetical protein NEICINOT_03175 [Neisseria cinerea ATCC 14685]|uniref:Uncharacterized protein n=1 Tax=Neisseria cinerea ATCC 14685 TaxID=546262 RepID=D0W0K8_NEICI|nr:hypothetical protein NEICINOT_03175 [Neisseria cinerea ATCC 14685]